MRTIYRVKLEITDVELEILEMAFTEKPTVEMVIDYLERKRDELIGPDCPVGCAVELPEISVMQLIIDRVRDQTDVKAYIMPIDLVEN